MKANNTQLYLVAYDVKDDKRLNEVHSIVKDYAIGGQKSAFECFLSYQQHQTIRQRLQAAIDTEIDRIMIIPINANKLATLGTAIPPKNLDFFYIG